MKKILALAAMAALTAGVSAYAANPFSDVTPNDWAYQAVADLSEQGVVEGYPDGTFKGERNITRYELAQIIARMLAKEDQLNAEQRGTLDRLAGEYADELANLGVRVSNLEKKVGNLSFSGDGRMRYQNKDAGAADKWDGRIRLNVKGQVNDSTYVQGRLDAEMNFKTSDDTNVIFDQLFVNHDFGDAVTVRLGRQPVVIGDQSGWLYGFPYGYDGAQAMFHQGRVNLTAGYGRFNKSDYTDGVKDQDAFFAKGDFDFSAAKLNLNYLKFTGDKKADTFAGYEIAGAGLTILVGDFRVFGEYWKDTNWKNGYDTAWNAGLGYGKLNVKKPGSLAADVAYNSVDRGIYFGGTGYQTNVLSYLTDSGTNADRVKYWNAIADVTLQKNVYLHGEYAFDVKTNGGDHSAADEDAWTLSLNYVF